jgi:hypothetical protein
VVPEPAKKSKTIPSSFKKRSTQPTPPPSPVNSTSIPSTQKIPNWVKGIFSFHAQGNLSDDDLIKALQFLIQQGIIKVK